MKASEIARDAIDLFFEYRDVHGYSEQEAKGKAVNEVQEYEIYCPEHIEPYPYASMKARPFNF